MGIGASTARMILKRYREDGIVFERKLERKERLFGQSGPTTEGVESTNLVFETSKHEKLEQVYPNLYEQDAFVGPYYNCLDYYRQISYWSFWWNNLVNQVSQLDRVRQQIWFFFIKFIFLKLELRWWGDCNQTNFINFISFLSNCQL